MKRIKVEDGVEIEDSKPKKKRVKKEKDIDKKSEDGKGNNKRVKVLKNVENKPTHIVYNMWRDQRVNDNYALLYAQKLAVDFNCPLSVVCVIPPKYMEYTMRQYTFLIEGLKEIEETLKTYNIPLHILLGEIDVLPPFLKQVNASTLVLDHSPLKIPCSWVSFLTSNLTQTSVHIVDAHNIVPVWVASDKIEYAARTIRPKIHNHLPTYLVEFPSVVVNNHVFKPSSSLPSLQSPIDWNKVLSSIKVDSLPSLGPSSIFIGGEKAGLKQLNSFLGNLAKYESKRNDPNEDCQSNISPWLHSGNLSAQRAALEARKHSSRHSKSVSSFLEELIVRRELSDNYCYYNKEGYDVLEGLYPQFDNKCWAQISLKDHEKDKREYVYNKEQFSNGETHDDLWNAAQLELVYKGKMHGFLRMYWAKKILEWTDSPSNALKMGIYLNDRFALDGCDPNGFVGVAWSVGGLHDNGWAERSVFGKIRYMNYEGCKRKFNIPNYTKKISTLVSKLKKK